MSEKNIIRSIQRALNILECFDMGHTELSFSQIVEMIKLPKSTTSRILSTLEYEGFLIRDRETQKYKLGYTVYLLGLVARKSMDVKTISIPYMEHITKITNETSNLYILEGLERVCIAQVESPEPIKQSLKIGEKYPIWLGATGKSMLAFLDEAVWYEMVKELKKFTENTVTDPKEFINELKDIRVKGYSVSLGEYYNEVGCIAAPIFNEYGEVLGCISMSGPIYRFPKDVEPIAKIIKDAASEISYKLGYRGNRETSLIEKEQEIHE